MRALGSGSLVLTACFASRLAWGAPAAAAPPVRPTHAPATSSEIAQPAPGTAAPTNPSAAEPPAPPPPAPPPPAPPPPDPAPPPPSAPEPAPPSAPQAPALEVPQAAPTPESVAPLGERHPETKTTSAADASVAAPVSRFERDYDAWPLTLEARFGFNARFGSSFDSSADDEPVDASYALGAYLAWKPEYALGLELEHSGLGRVRALSAENSIDAEYSVTSAWLAARVFPWRSERLDVFLNLRLGLAMQHLDALGTRRESSSITVPAASFSCGEWDGPGLGLGAALGLDYRLARHVAFVTRLDATGERLSGAELGTCASGIGSVTTLSGTFGIAYDFETAKR